MDKQIRTAENPQKWTIVLAVAALLVSAGSLAVSWFSYKNAENAYDLSVKGAKARVRVTKVELLQDWEPDSPDTKQIPVLVMVENKGHLATKADVKMTIYTRLEYLTDIPNPHSEEPLKAVGTRGLDNLFVNSLAEGEAREYKINLTATKHDSSDPDSKSPLDGHLVKIVGLSILVSYGYEDTTPGGTLWEEACFATPAKAAGLFAKGIVYPCTIHETAGIEESLPPLLGPDAGGETHRPIR